MFKFNILSFLLLLVFSFASAKESRPIKFSHIGINDGLSQSTVFSIAQDKQGFLWFATYDGVNKYDGYDFTVYRHAASNPNTISNDISRTILIDSMNRVWIGTRSGLSMYDREKDVFRNYYVNNDKKVAVGALCEYSSELLLLSTSNGLMMFDINEKSFSDTKIPESIRKLKANALIKKDEHVYIGTEHGLYIYIITSQHIKHITSIGDVKIQSVLQHDLRHIWIATEGNGLFLYNYVDDVIRNYKRVPGNPSSLVSDYIRSLAFDSQNRLWIGTLNGLSIYNDTHDNFTSYINNPLDDKSLSQNSVRSIYMDTQGCMWLGTYYGGLSYYHPLRNRFLHFEQSPFENSISDNVVSCMVEDKNHNIWIGTNNGGLDLYNPQKKEFTHYPIRDNSLNETTSNDIKTVYPDPVSDYIYVGAHAGGLSILQPNTRQIKRFTTSNSNIPANDVYGIVPDRDNVLWIGTLSGLAQFDTSTQQFKMVHNAADNTSMHIRRITVLFKDSKERLWIGSEEGLQVFITQNGELVRKVDLPKESLYCNAFINCIFQAKEGMVWLGTRNGLFGVDEQTGRVVHYTTDNFLPNNVVYGIMEDSLGRLWLSSNMGLSCYNPKTEKARSYTEADGLQSNQFDNASYCKASDGMMYFGGINGITAFHPEQITDNPYAPSVIITGLSIFNKPVLPDDDTKVLKQNICDTKKIELRASQSSFTISFTVPNYIAGTHNTFAYKLEGFDKEWYTTTNLRQVSYSNLPQGKYVFKVKAANNDGVWNETPTSLEIVILPVWYKTWWAIMLFVVALALLAFFIFRFLWIRKSMRAEIEMERKDKEHQEKLSQMKIRFYVNISHELRTPLTLIISPLQEIMNKVNDKWIREQLTYVYKNANRLLHLVNQLMDYRRAELGIFELKVKCDNMYERIMNNFVYYDQIAKKNEIDYNFFSDLQNEKLLFDANYLDLILNNLLSNAFKYTNKGDRIYVRLAKENDNVLLQVCDTGVGIPMEKQQKVFERFYQVDNEHLGSGIGLSLVQRLVELHHGHIDMQSEEGKGTTFSVYIPQNVSAYTENEFADESTEQEKAIEKIYSTNSKEMYVIDTENSEDKEVESGDSKRGTILIVEDNKEIRKFICTGLKDSFTTIEAGNGEEALDVMKDNEIDLVVTDVMMPVMDGITLCKQIKNNIRTCHIPVYILSAKGDLKDQLEGLQVGADDYIQKPFSISVLIAKIQNTIRTRYRLFEKFSKTMDIEPEKITTNALDEELIKKAVEIVEKNMSNIEFSTDNFAKEMGMSRSNLYLKLKAITGQSAIDFIHKIRFAEACRLMKEERYNISEISYMVGYNTPSYFATRFKKYVGCLPTEYLKLHK